MKDFIILFIAGIALLLMAVMDWMGVRFLLKKEYRGLPKARAWQKRNAVLEAALGLCGIGYYISENETIRFVLGIITIADVILIGINSRLFMRAEKNKAGTE
ncbi:MAG: hypothetical protein EOM54_12500 [Clostridia bacterium]|nr:hypothetical protein [Clostridia bacterium]